MVRRILAPSLATKIPGVPALAELIARVAQRRAGRVPIGLLALLPVAILLDVFDAADELFLGPLGIAGAFFLETAFVLGVTGRAGYALGFAALDLIPFVDLAPVATLTVLTEAARAWNEGAAERRAATGPIIDV